jgi:cysteine desulfuration protein SufE
MTGLSEEAREIVEEFQFLDDWDDRYQYLIGMGRKLPALDAAIMTEENRLKGCQSVVHFKADFADGYMRYQAGSDAAIVQGLIALMMRVYSGRAPDEILANPPSFLTEIGLDEHLSPTRKNGLASMVTAIMDAARNYVDQSSATAS